jgi:hypothetical protein
MRTIPNTWRLRPCFYFLSVAVVLAVVTLPLGPLYGVPVREEKPKEEGKEVLANNRKEVPNQLKQIGLALHNYHTAYRTFPAAAITDKNGKPLLSWRVAILPFMGVGETLQAIQAGRAVG